MKKLRKFIIFFVLLTLVFSTLDVRAGNNGGTALDFDGTNDYVDATNNGGARRTAASLGLPTAAITVEAWVYPRASAVWVGIANFIQDNGGFEYGWHLGLTTGTVAGNTRFEFAVAGGGVGLTYLFTNNNYPLNRWHHVVGTYDGTTMRIYVNGVLDTSSNAQSGAITYADSWLTLGAYRDDNEFYPFNGMIDEVRIWNSARSQAQIQSTMFGEISGATAGLVAYWRLNEGAGTTTADATGNALHLGTLTNMTPASDWIPSTAPLGDATVNTQTNVAGFWIASQLTTSGGLTVANNSFLVDTGDDVIFGHNNATGTTTSDLPAGVGSRLSRIWYCDLNNQNANGGNLNLTFNLTTAGGGTVVNDATYYSLLERAGTSGPFAVIVASASSVNVPGNTVTFTGVSSNTVCSYITLGTNAPYVVSITRANPNPTNATSVDFTVTFSKSVSGVDTGDFTLTVSGVSGASVTGVSGVGATRTVTVNTGSGDGTLRLDLIDNDTIVDTYSVPLGGTGAGNGNYTTGETYTIDKTAPTITIGTPSLPLTNTGPVDFPVTVTGADTINLVAGNVTLNTTGTATGTISITNGTTANPTVTISGITGDGTLGISIAAGVAADLAGNTSLAAGPSGTVTVDNAPPVVTIGVPSLTLTNTGPVDFPVTVTGANTVNLVAGNVTLNTTGTATGTISITNGTTANPTVTISGITGDGTLGISIAAGVAADLAGNTSLAADPSGTFTVDNTLPVVAIGAPSLTLTNTGPVDFPVTVTGANTINLVAGDVTLNTTGTATGTISITNGTTANPTVTISGITGDGTLGISIAAGVAADLAGNTSLAAGPSGTFTVDNTPPTVSMSSALPDPTNISPIPVTVTFSESVTGFIATDIVATNGTVSNFAGAGTTYTFDLTPTGQGLVSADIVAGVAVDAANNGNTAAATFSRTYDTVSPTVSMSSAAPDPTNTSPIPVTVTFSTSVTGFVAADITPANGTVSNFAGAGTTYTFDLIPSGEGLVSADIAAGVAQDTAGNLNLAAPTFSRTYDSIVPTVSMSSAAPDPTNASPIPVTVTFSESVTGFIATDIVATNGTVSNFAGAGTTYTFDLTPAGQGLVSADIAAGVAVDAATNSNTAAATFSRTYDTVAPTLSLVHIQSNNPNPALAITGNTITLTFTASTDITTPTVTIAGHPATVVGGPVNWSATYVVGAGDPNGVVAFNISGFSDTAGNAGSPVTTTTDGSSVTISNTVPTVIGSTPIHHAALFTGPIQIILEFNKDVVHDGSGDAANNLVNYLLVEAGANRGIDTVSCASGLASDDRNIGLNTVAYNDNGGAGPFIAVLNINSGAALPIGSYQLFVCGTKSIRDLAGNVLNNGVDSQIAFTVQLAQADSLPATGFAPERVTVLPTQPADKAYAGLGSLWLEIPSLGVKSSIVAVPQTADSWDVTWLGNQAGWLQGTTFPTWVGNSVLTAHLTNANGKNGPFAGLKNLVYGDRIIVHMQGQQYIYEVRETRTLTANNSSYVFKSLDKYSYLTLLTCQGYNQQTDKYTYRRVVRAVLVSVQADK